MKVKCLMIIGLVFVFSGPIVAGGKKKELTLSECIHESFKKNLDIRIERFMPKIAEQKIMGTRSQFDPFVELKLQNIDSLVPLSSAASIAAGGLESTESEELHIETALRGKAPTGLEYQMFWNQIDSENTFNSFQPELTGQLRLRLVQPLLKDAWVTNNVAFIRIAKKSKAIAEEEFELKVAQIVRKLAHAYWDLVLARYMLELRMESLKLARSLLKENSKRVEAGLISELELIQSEAGVAAREVELLESKRRVLDQQNVLIYQMGFDVREWLLVEIAPTDDPALKETILVRDIIIQEGIEHRPEYRKATIEIDKVNILVKYYRNQLFPRIDLEASLIANGVENGFSDLNNALFGFDYPQWTVGGSIKFPLMRYKEKQDYKIAKLQVAQTLVRLKRIEQVIALEIDSAAGNVETYKKSVDASEKSVRLAFEALKAEEKKLDAGLSTSHNVLDFQEKFMQAKIQNIQSLCNYELSLIDLAYYMGALLQDKQIEITENSLYAVE